MKYSSFDHFFTVLGNKQRVKILQLLSSKGPKSVSAIADILKDGKERIYAVNKDTIQPLLEQIDRHVRKYCVENCKHWD